LQISHSVFEAARLSLLLLLHHSAGSVFFIGQMQIKVPKAMTKPPIHIQMTSGRTSAFNVA
jgi:hypothetical protein